MTPEEKKDRAEFASHLYLMTTMLEAHVYEHWGCRGKSEALVLKALMLLQDAYKVAQKEVKA